MSQLSSSHQVAHANAIEKSDSDESELSSE